MTLQFSDGAYNHASGTRDAFGALSDELVAEGYPPMTSRSGDREPAEQLKIWHERMTLAPNGRRVYGTKRWKGLIWYQIHPDAVGIPGTSNHEARRSNDLRAPYNADTVAARRAKVLARKHNITREGEAFGELWHWTHWGPLGTIGPAPAGGENTAPVPEEDEDMKIIRWAANGACWLMTDESTDYIATGQELAALEAIFGPAKTVENAALTAVVASLKVPWAAMESTFRSQAFDNESRFGKGTSWTRTMAEADRQVKFDAALAKSIDDLEKAIGNAKTAAG